MLNFYRALIGNTVFANVILALIVILGVFAVNSITKESQPEMSIPFYSVTVDYLGADPEEVEEGVTRKIEAKLDGMRGVKEFTSTSREGRSRMRRFICSAVVKRLRCVCVSRLRNESHFQVLTRFESRRLKGMRCRCFRWRRYVSRRVFRS